MFDLKDKYFIFDKFDNDYQYAWLLNELETLNLA